jgi:hypothetical protein
MMCTVAEGVDILRSIVICYIICYRFLVILLYLYCDYLLRTPLWFVSYRRIAPEFSIFPVCFYSTL